jgi:hypothetical protein
VYANWNRWSGMPVKKRTGLLESGLASDGLAGLWMDWIAQADGSMLAGTGPSFQWARALRSASAIREGHDEWARARARVSGVGRNDRQVLGGEKMTEEVGSVAAG